MRARLRLAGSGGFTLPEMLVVMAILGIVLAGLTQLFASANNTAADLSSRFEAQQNGRLALDALRRELHCASEMTTRSTSPTLSSITIKLGSYCPSAPASPGTSTTVTWCTVGSSQRFALWRYVGNFSTSCPDSAGVNKVKKADYLTKSEVFGIYNAPDPVTHTRGTLSIDLPVDMKPTKPGG